MATFADTKKLYDLGWNIVTAPLGVKRPDRSWRDVQKTRRTLDDLKNEFSSGERNIFLITGELSGVAVLDCDDTEAEEYWRERLGAAMLDSTTGVRTDRGRHYYFKIEGPHKSRSSGGGESGKWDLRADGGGVIVPPSKHPSGRLYEWSRGPDALLPAPEALWTGDGQETAASATSTLAHLLAHTPEVGQRNSWLTKVSGHYAKLIPFEDAFTQTVRSLAPDGLDGEEIDKLIHSIWTREQEQKGKAAPVPTPKGEGGNWRVKEPTESTGWLASGDVRILARCRRKDGDGFRETLEPWLNADLRVMGIFLMPDDSRTYHLEIRPTDSENFEVDLPSYRIGNSTRLREWLAGQGLGLAAPDSLWPRGMGDSSRMTRYLESQGAPVQRAANSLGWHDEANGFLTHEGVLRAGGESPFEGVRPHPRVREWAPYRYGLRDGAAEVLREALTFHFPEVTSVFGAWWAACFLKPQISQIFSQFPFMAIEASSESGKSTGFFPIMLELGGNTLGKSIPTKAAMRDYLSAHRNGIVWVDDVDDVQPYGELIRSTTVEGSVVKKGSDHQSQMAVQLQAALVLTGESLGLGRQKALADRCVDLRVSSPVGRKSLRGNYSQWEDIVTFKAEHVLTDYAGTFVIEALRHADELAKKSKRWRVGKGGRTADTMTIMRIGAWLLEILSEKDDHQIEQDVEQWIASHGARYSPYDNTLTTVLLPQALSRLGIKKEPEGPDVFRKSVATPVFVTGRDGKGTPKVWFSPKLLAAWWRDLHYGRIEQRTESEESIVEQARACNAGGTKRKYFYYNTGDGGTKYWRLPDDLGKKVLARAEGVEE